MAFFTSHIMDTDFLSGSLYLYGPFIEGEQLFNKHLVAKAQKKLRTFPIRAELCKVMHVRCYPMDSEFFGEAFYTVHNR
jgi:hypothetical protein